MLLLTAGLLAVAMLATAAPLQAETYDSPQACLEAAQQLVEQKEYAGFVDCMTSDSQSVLAAGLTVMPLVRASMAAIGGPEAVDEAKKKMANVYEVIERNGVEAPTMEQLAATGRDPEKMKALLNSLLEPVEDHAAYLVELMAAFETVDKDGATRPTVVDSIQGELTDINIEGDIATGTLTREVGGRQISNPMRFKKVDGGWLIDIQLGGRDGA
ncbi:MAG: hypothetical protein DWQ31_11540 [Planctomycetota bacterium]|nr:MAG: hypothetical protein DWQ31_12560 [Planctomycetota bacterium]REJ67408.1 MAG: hypothetical protein DWQ31_11540 [Planctomycetota bacterium]REJ89308.1 MAG: hypothetical protein DWQ35_18400 [Planctomycetota bacterium]REK22883.1 MAG: hypothetical protein DWQ42_16365 [Planctomycetota bacterium]REK37417.1 MAG: hypothetical protein DWQ46_22310 [Planctomycetota bacterium]